MKNVMIFSLVVLLVGCSGMRTSGAGFRDSSGTSGSGGYGVGTVPANPLDSTSPGFLPLV